MDSCTVNHGGHEWVAGFMVVPDEDLDTIARMRAANGADPVTCSRCESVYPIGTD